LRWRQTSEKPFESREGRLGGFALAEVAVKGLQFAENAGEIAAKLLLSRPGFARSGRSSGYVHKESTQPGFLGRRKPERRENVPNGSKSVGVREPGKQGIDYQDR
jgi:hypothetical protein